MPKATFMALLLLPLAVAPAPAQPADATTPAAVTRWEYRTASKDQIRDLGNGDFAAGLNALGGQGWELAAVDAAYIFKRPQRHAGSEDRQGRVALLEADVAMRRDRLAWSERMAKKGFVGDAQVEADRLALRAAELALDRARRELRGLTPGPKQAPEEGGKPQP